MKSIERRAEARAHEAEPSMSILFEGDAPNPLEPLAIIGDVHGELNCLNALVEQLREKADHARWIFVGDYIDRGEHSADVLQVLRDLQAERPNTICLKGNHEAMLLSFLAHPEKAGDRWMRNGGLQTMASFGCGIALRERNSPESLRAARDYLVNTAPDGLLDWVSERDLQWSSGNVSIVHAAADPLAPMEAQREDALLWGHRRFSEQARTDGQWVVHGHTIVDQPLAHNGIVSVDTGAYATGRLTAAVIDQGQVEFLHTSS